MEYVSQLNHTEGEELHSVWGLLQKDIRDAFSIAGFIVMFHMVSIFNGTAGRGTLFFYYGLLYLFARWRFPKMDVTMIAASAKMSLLVQHARIMIVLAPIFIFSGFVPLFKMYAGVEGLRAFASSDAVLYALGFLVSFGLMVECIVWCSLLNPSAGSYIEQWEQAVAFFRNLAIGFGMTFGFLVLDWSWEKLLSLNPMFRWAPVSINSQLIKMPVTEVIFSVGFFVLLLFAFCNWRQWCRVVQDEKA